MKKLIAGVAAGALLLSFAGVVLARGSSVVQFGGASSYTVSSSSTGGNVQSGKGSQLIETGDSGSGVLSLTASNVNVGKSGKVFQGSETSSQTISSSVNGGNVQTGSSGHHGSSSSQEIVTGSSSSFAGSATVSNVNVSF
ncbi:MAG: hypothetical protein ABSE04_02255 [Candidatus Microgenomates bacterium]|jgi:hypothetical protein